MNTLEFYQLFISKARENLGIKQYFKVPYKDGTLTVELKDCIKIYGREQTKAKIEAGEFVEVEAVAR